MAHSIEARLPFLDYKLVETALSLPNEFKIYNGWTKYLLRSSIQKELPSSIVWRKNKIGFEAPADIWLKENRQFIDDVISKSSIIAEIANHLNIKDSNRCGCFFSLRSGKRRTT